MLTPTPPRVFNPRTCALGCGIPGLILVSVIGVLVLRGCPGEVARWTDRTQGTVVVVPGMTREQVQQRTTVKLGQYGNSNSYVDFALPAEGILFHGIQMFTFDSEPDGRVSSVSMITAGESWPDLVRAVRRTESILLANGWKPDPGQPSILTMTEDAHEAEQGITGSGAIAGSEFRYSKGDRRFRLAAGGLWSGIPSWRNPDRAEVFWRNMGYSPVAQP